MSGPPEPNRRARRRSTRAGRRPTPTSGAPASGASSGVPASGASTPSSSAAAHATLGNGVVRAALGGELGAFGAGVAGSLGAEVAGLSQGPASNAERLSQLAASGGVGRDGAATPGDAAAIGQLISSSRGAPLPADVALRMGAALGHDLSGVTLHTDPQAAAAADALSASAFARGSHVYFGEGAFTPGTAAGDELLAHELTHVVQHAEGRLSGGAGLSISDPSDHAEREAASVASDAMGSLPAGLSLFGPATSAFVPGGQGIGGGSGITSTESGPVMRNFLGDALSAGADFVGDTVDGAVDLAGDAVDAVGGAIEGGLDAMVRAVSPELADLLQAGIGGVASELLGDAFDAFMTSVLGDVDLSSLVTQLTGEIQGVFETIQGVLEGDAACCETFDQWMQTLSDVLTSLNDNPVAVAIRDTMSAVGDVLGDLISLFLGAQLQAFLMQIEGAQALWNGYMAVIETGTNAIKDLADWVWDGVCDLLGIDAGEGNIVDHLLQMGQEWFEGAMADEGPGIADALSEIGQVWWENSDLKKFYDLIQACQEVWNAGVWLWENWGSETIAQDAETAGPMVQGFLSAFGFAQEQANAFGAWAGEVFPDLLGRFESFCDSIGAGWFADGLRLFATPIVAALSLGAELGAWLADGGTQTIADWASAAYTYMEPLVDVLVSLVLAVANPPMIPVILAGWGWRMLPDCLKPPIVDLLLDVIIDALVAMPEMPGLDGLFSLIKPGLIGALAAFRGRTDDEKIIITNKVAKILSGSPEFVIGFVLGMLRGIVDGILDPLMLIWMMIEGVVWLVDTAGDLFTQLNAGTEGATTAADQATTAADQATATATDAAQQAEDQAAALADTPITLMSVDVEALEQQAAEASAGASDAVAQGVDPMTDPEVLSYLARMGEEIRPPAEVIGETFVPAFEEAFGGEGVASISDLATMLGAMWETMQQLIGEAGQWLGEQMCTLMLSDSGEYDIGHGIGYVAGMITFEVILAVLTGGLWETLGPVARAVVQFLDLGGAMFGAAFRALGELGELLMRAIRPIMEFVGSTPMMRTLQEAFSELAEKLVRMSDELLAMLGFADEAAEGAAGAVRRTDGLADEGVGLADEGVGLADEGAAVARRTDGAADDGLAAVRRSVAAGDDVKLGLAAQRIRPEPGTFDVVVHADGDRLLVLEGGAWRELQPSELAAQMRADGFNGESVRLIACGSGQADGAAARLSRELGTDVKAPNDTVWIHPDGTLTVGPTPDAPTGGWSRTSPDGASEMVEDSARLSDEALEGIDDAVRVGRIDAEVDINVGAGLSPEAASDRMWEQTRARVEELARTRREWIEASREPLATLDNRIAGIDDELRALATQRNKKIEAIQNGGDREALAKELSGINENITQANARRKTAVAERQQINTAPPGANDNNLVFEAAYDTQTGDLVVVKSGSTSSSHLQLPENSVDSTIPGKCGMARADDVLIERALASGRTPQAGEILNIRGGLTFDSSGRVQYVSECANCVKIHELNPSLQHVGSRPTGIDPDIDTNTKVPLPDV